MSLSGYEEPLVEDETTAEEITQTTPSSSAYGSPSLPQDGTITPQNRSYQSPSNDDSAFTSTPSYSTPRPKTNSKPPTIATYSSPYESLKREVQGATDESSTSTLPSTPRAHQQSPNPQSSPFLPASTSRPTAAHRTPANDVLLHRILDKNWRLQATPHSQARPLTHHLSGKVAETPLPSARRRRNKPYASDLETPDSSPIIPAPQLHAEIFDSPVRRPRVPGVSVLTPARRRISSPGAKSGDGFGKGAGGVGTGVWDSDSDEEQGVEGMSPPKTMQFHVPQSRLLKTPGECNALFGKKEKKKDLSVKNIHFRFTPILYPIPSSPLPKHPHQTTSTPAIPLNKDQPLTPPSSQPQPAKPANASSKTFS